MNFMEKLILQQFSTNFLFFGESSVVKQQYENPKCISKEVTASCDKGMLT